MYVISTENNKIKNRAALVIPTKEWSRLTYMITKKNDDMIIENKIKKLKNERQAVSKAITESWATTIVV